MLKILICALSIIYYISAYAAPTLSISPQTVALGEPFRLTITQTTQTAEPDFAPLKLNFTIMSTEHSVAYTAINGQAQTTNQWSLLLVANTAGHLTIPAIHIGTETTTETFIDVTNTTTNTAHTHQSVFFVDNLEPKHPYVNQQMLYTVKLYARDQLLNINYHPPQIDNAIIIALGNSKHSEQQINNEIYAVEEQRYAIFPQKPGKMLLVGPKLQALVYKLVPTPINLTAKITSIKVKPQINASSTWLPTTSLQLQENYSKLNSTIKVGESITRTITIRASALPAQFLPALKFSNTDNFNVYTEKPVIKNLIQNQNLVGVAQIKITYLFNQPGTAIIPELRIPWFDTNAAKFSTATLPSKTLQITGTAAKPVIHKQQPSTPMPAHAVMPKLEAAEHQHVLANKFWWLSAGLCLLLIASFYAIYRWISIRNKSRSTFKRLRKACLQNQPIAAYQALLELWQYLPQDTQLEQFLTDLNQAIYAANNKTKWQGKELWQWIKVHYRQQHQAQKKSQLPPLNLM